MSYNPLIIKPILTVITVCLNDKEALKKTFESFLHQDVFLSHDINNFEYIVVDGKSNDGTISMLENYEKKYPLSFISEKDGGIYDAMNKGLLQAHGKWVQFLNAGDVYADHTVLSHVLEWLYIRDDDVIYGDTILYFNSQYESYAPSQSVLCNKMEFIHQSAFFNRKMHLNYAYDLKYKLASDNDAVIRMIVDKKSFFQIRYPITKYDYNGISFLRSNEYLNELKLIQKEKGVSIEWQVKNWYSHMFSIFKNAIFKYFPSLRWRIIKLKHHLFNPEEEKLYAEYKARQHNSKLPEYNRWLSTITDASLLSELRTMSSTTIEDAFYRSLTFGTGGLRGIIGPGTNRMNHYVVAQASQGLSNYIMAFATNAVSVSSTAVFAATTDSAATNSAPSSVAFPATATVTAPSSAPSVVIGYDSRIKSDFFAQTAASVFAANGIIVHLWTSLTPVPTVSYAVRTLRASAGIMITASHNPAKYNGYKVYGSDGCQITTETARDIQEQIKTVDIFNGVKTMDFDEAIKSGAIQYIDNSVLDSFLAEVKRQSVLYGDKVDRDVSIVYTPLNGTGLIPVTRVLSDSGFTNITLVEEQKNPDGNFPTCPYPNPEIREAMELGLKYAKKVGADLLIATDPDCDRCGIAVKSSASSTSITSGTSGISSISSTSYTVDMVEMQETRNTGDTGETGNTEDDTASTTGDYVLLTGNEVGLLLLDYICSQKRKHNKMPTNPVLIKTIVTTPLAEKIAKQYGVSVINVLTGFKYIGEQIGLLEEQHRASDYLLGFEESYGYLTGTYVRDKDGVNAAYMIAEMFAFYKTQGKSLLEKLEELYKEYGYCENVLLSYEFPGSAGMERMKAIMSEFRSEFRDDSLKYFLGMPGMPIVEKEDYSLGIHGLPKSDVLKFVVKASSNKISSDEMPSDKASSDAVSSDAASPDKLSSDAASEEMSSSETSEISVFIRPSGTEPQLKAYINVLCKEKSTAMQIAENIKHSLDNRINHV